MLKESVVIRVGIAEMKIAEAPHKIRTSGLGSCVGVVLYDSIQKLAGMAHIMLPNAALAKGQKNVNTAKFADTALRELKDVLLINGAKTVNLRAKIAGGSQMFKFSQTGNEHMRVGPRNIQAVKDELEKLNIILVSEDVGGSSGRTIEFDPATSLLEIRTVNQGTIVI